MNEENQVHEGKKKQTIPEKQEKKNEIRYIKAIRIIYTCEKHKNQKNQVQTTRNKSSVPDCSNLIQG